MSIPVARLKIFTDEPMVKSRGVVSKLRRSESENTCERD